MSLSREIFLYFLTDNQGRSYYIENGVLKMSATPKWLEDAPQGWLDNTVSFGRSSKYYGINRSYTIPLKFVNDGASIIRRVYYSGKGIEEQLNLVILKHNDENDLYELYYKGEIDLVMIEDLSAEGVQVNVMEGGLVKYLRAYENTVYEFPCDGTISQNKLVNISGILFDDKFNYSAIEVPDVPIGKSYACPNVFIDNTGDNIGILKGDESFEDITDMLPTYFLTSSNYIFKSVNPVTITIRGRFIVSAFGGSGSANCIYRFVTSNNTTVDIVTESIPNGQTVIKEFTHTMTLAAGEALFTYIDNPVGSGAGLSITESPYTIEFQSKFPDTKTWAIDCFDLFKLLVGKVSEGQYEGVSSLLESNRHLVITSGDALRGTHKAVIKTSLADFFESMNVILNASLSNQTLPGQKETLFIERKEYVFNSSSVDINLGEVSDLKITLASEYMLNNLKIGYAPQQYDEKAGKQEYNTTAQYKAPISRVQKELSLISKYRADSYGIERTRFNSGSRSTTSNSSDNAVFILNITDTTTPLIYTASRVTPLNIFDYDNQNISFENYSGIYFTPDSVNEVLTFGYTSALEYTITGAVTGIIYGTSGQSVTVNLLRNGVVEQSLSAAADPAGANFNLTINKTLVLSPNDTIKIQVSCTADSGTLDQANINFQSATLSEYSLRRVVYDSVSGIANPETAYNIEQLTTARLVKTHGNWIRSVLFNQPDSKLTFLTLDKNKDLFTQKGAEIFKESADIRVSSLDAPLMYPLILEFKTKVPINFADLLNSAANSHIKASYNGVEFYGFPIQVSQKAALNDAQEWKLLCSPLTNPADFINLDVDGLNYMNLMAYGLFIPHACPVKFVPLDNVLPAQYHTKHMDGWWFSEQIAQYVETAKYYQKWQTNDVIELQCQTNGLGPVSAMLIDCHGNTKATISLTQKTDTAVVAPMALFEGSVPLTGLDDGLYYIVWSAGSGEAIAKFISEPLHIKADWPNTILFEYSNRINKQSVIFTTGYSPSIRVEAAWTLQDFDPESKFSVYENQPADLEMINGIPYRVHNLFLGDNQGLPPWVLDKLNRILLFTTCKADGLEITRNQDAKFEKINIPGWPMSYYNIKVREKNNRDGSYLDVDGNLDKNITVIYNIKTKGFGSNDETVQITKIQ